jgi:hypothetical protein
MPKAPIDRATAAGDIASYHPVPQALALAVGASMKDCPVTERAIIVANDFATAREISFKI